MLGAPVTGISEAVMSKRPTTPPRRPRSGPKRPQSRDGARKLRTGKSAVSKPRPAAPKGAGPKDTVWFYGVHTVTAAIANAARPVYRILVWSQVGADVQAAVTDSVAAAKRDSALIEMVDRADLHRILPEGAVHQGIAALVGPLSARYIEDIEPESAGKPARVLVLDQATDPQNIGAAVRTAAAFGAAAVIVPDKHTPPVTSSLAKAASGGLEAVPLVRVTNLVRALYSLKDAGFWCVGLDADGAEPLSKAIIDGPCALVMGAEGKGLRRLTAQACDALAAIPIGANVSSLNVSAAAAIALYEAVRNR